MLQEEKWMTKLFHDMPKVELFFVGGCVRDVLLKRTTKDIDLVIRNITRQEIETWFGANGSVNYVGKQFGVYKFIPEGATEEIDIALPRTEHPTKNSHGGYKEFAIESRSDFPIALDLARRDFTVNAMAFDVKKKELIDPYHGQRDVVARIIRAVGKPGDRFSEDLSRILRAIRFACSLGFHIEEETWQAMKDLAPRLQDKVEQEWIVPRETIGKEFLKSFFSDPSCTLARYEQAGLLSLLFPGLDVATAKEHLSVSAGLPPRLLLALFLLSFDQDAAEKCMATYHFSQFPKTERLHVDASALRSVIRSVHALDLVEDPSRLPGSLFERLFLGPRSQDLIDLLKLTRPHFPSLLLKVEARVQKIRALWGDDIPELVRGEDLIALQLKPGPQFRRIQQAVRDAQLDGRVRSKEEALRFASELVVNTDK